MIFIFGFGPVCQQVRGQESYNPKFEKTFIYRDSDGNQHSGNLSFDYEIKKLLDKLDIFLRINVSWNNKDNLITDKANMPYLHIGEYDYEFDPINSLNCISFNSNREYTFQDSQILKFASDKLPIPKSITIGYEFSYVLKKEDFESTNMENISFLGQTDKILRTKLEFPDSWFSVENDVKNTQDNDTLIQNKEFRSAFIDLESRIEKLKNRYVFYKDSFDIIEPDKNISEYGNKLINTFGDSISELNTILFELTKLRNHINNTIVGIDTLINDIDNYQLFKNQNDFIGYDLTSLTDDIKLENDVRNFRRDYIYFRQDVDLYLQDPKIKNLASVDPEESIEILDINLLNIFTENNDFLDSLKLLLIKMENQYDSLIIDNRTVEPSTITGFRSKLDSFSEKYNMISSFHDSIYDEYYMSDYYSYNRNNLNSIHSRIGSSKEFINSKFDSLNTRILEKSKIVQGANESKWTINWLWSIPIIALIIIVFIFKPFRKKSKKKQGLKLNSQLNTPDINLYDSAETISDDISAKPVYYPLTWQELNKSYIRFVFFSENVINEIYNISRNSITRKMVYEVGGYLFGRFEKKEGNGVGSYNIFVEQFVPAREMESSDHYQLDFGTETVEEMEHAIQDNQNLVLLGWFHTHPGHSPVMSDNNAAIYKKYFTEKWHISLIVDPGVEGCSAAVYSKGLEPVAIKCGTSGEFFKWKDLVTWIKDPVNEKLRTFIPAISVKKVYYTARLNDKWCDSIVSTVKIEKKCFKEIAESIKKKDLKFQKSRIAGFFYGKVSEEEVRNNGGTKKEYSVLIEEYIESDPGNIPSKTSGFHLMGWLAFDDCELFELIEPALIIHEKEFNEKWQLSFLLNRNNNELRIFSRRQNLEMNNNVIETNEFNLMEIIDWTKSV